MLFSRTIRNIAAVLHSCVISAPRSDKRKQASFGTRAWRRPRYIAALYFVSRSCGVRYDKHNTWRVRVLTHDPHLRRNRGRPHSNLKTRFMARLRDQTTSRTRVTFAIFFGVKFSRFLPIEKYFSRTLSRSLRKSEENWSAEFVAAFRWKTRNISALPQAQLSEIRRLRSLGARKSRRNR